ncbi:935_t:CDS:2, partial [Funneliformis caledonium]
INSTGKIELGPPNAGILFPPWKLESLSFLQKATSKPHLGWNSGLIATIPSIFYKIFDGTLKFQKFEPLQWPLTIFSLKGSNLRNYINRCDEKVFSPQIGWWLWYSKGYLDGMLENWLHLQEKALKLRDVDENFWSMAVSQVPYVSFIESRWDGWISALFPYNSSKCKLTDNSIFPTHIPSGLLNVPFELDMGKRFRLSIVAGFFGARQEKIDEVHVVSPVICWYVV